MRRIRSDSKGWLIASIGLALTVAMSLVLAFAGPALGADTSGVRPLAGPAALDVKSTTPYIAGQVLVRTQPKSGEKIADLAAKSGFKVLDKVDALSLYTLQVPTGGEAQALAALRSNPDVVYAELNAVATEAARAPRAGRPDSLSGATSDPGFNDPYLGYQWNLRAINGLAALGSARGSGVTVAAIGSGVALDNPELAPRLVAGYNFIDNTSTPADDHGFGTFDAGLIAATANNGIGVVGVAPEVSLMPLKALRRSGDVLEVSHSTVVAAINYALDHGAKVIHIEIAWDAPSQSVADAVALARSRGAVVVAPAHRPYPASYAGVIGVSALNDDDSHPDWGGSGSQVKLSAPGGSGMISTWPSPGSCPIATCPYYGDGQVAFASSHVAGVAALVLSAHPDWTAAQVESALVNSATDLGAKGWDADFGYGKVNAAAALSGDPSNPPPPPPPTATPTPIASSEPAPLPTSACVDSKGEKIQGCIGNNGRLVVYTFFDVNNNGIMNPNDIPLPGVTVQVLDINGNPIPGVPPQQSALGPDGLASAQFFGLDSGRSYRVRVTAPPGYAASVTNEYIVEASSFAFCCTVVLQFPFRPTVTTPTPTVTPYVTDTGASPTPTRTPTKTRTPGPSPTPTKTPTPTITPTLPFNKPGGRVQLPAIFAPPAGPGEQVEPWIAIQNVGSDYTKAILFLWGEYSGYCEPQAPGPFKVECTGLLAPGSSWNFRAPNLPSAAVGGIVYSVPADRADEACAAAAKVVQGEMHARGWQLWEKDWWNHKWGEGEPLAVSVNRRFYNPVTGQSRASAYTGISEYMEGVYDARYGGFMAYAPVNYVNYDGCNTVLTIQNSGDECTSIEIWYKEQDDCLRAYIDDVPYLAPGESVVVRPPAFLGPNWAGSAWIRSTQPLGIVVDIECQTGGAKSLSTYTGVPAQTFDTLNSTYSPGSFINYATLMYREEYGWDTTVTVQNLSGTTNAKVKVYFYDHTGGIIATAVDWICPRGSQDFKLSAINNLPGQYVGAVEVQSQQWWTPGETPVQPPYIMSVIQLSNKTNGQAVAYNAVTGGSAALTIPLAVKEKKITTGDKTITWNAEIALKNLNANPGNTTVRIDFYDQNGYITSVCQTLNEKFIDYIRLVDMGILPNGFNGSAVITATCSDQEGGPMLAATVLERGRLEGSPNIPQDLLKAYEAVPIHQAWYNPPMAPDACPGCQQTSCPATQVIFDLCGAEAGGVSVYSGAQVTIRDARGEPVYVGGVDANGQIVVPNLQTGRTYSVEVNPVNRPVPFPNGNVDKVQMAGFANSVLVPCQRSGGPAVVDLNGPTGVIQGYVAAACTAVNSTIQGRKVQLWAPAPSAGASATLLAERTTNADGYFQFTNISPCEPYELRLVNGANYVTVAGVLAGAPNIQAGGSVNSPQLYTLSDATGAICNVLPNPP